MRPESQGTTPKLRICSSRLDSIFARPSWCLRDTSASSASLEPLRLFVSECPLNSSLPKKPPRATDYCCPGTVLREHAAAPSAKEPAEQDFLQLGG